MKICLVSHYEFPNLEKGEDCIGLEVATRKFLDIAESTCKEHGKVFHSTFCAAFHHDEERSVVDEMPDILHMLVEKGHEIGVHTHVDYQRLEDHVRFLMPDRERLLVEGFNVYCWAPGDWYHLGEATLRELERAGYLYDLTVIPYLKPFEHANGKYKLDYTSCKETEPFYPSYKDVCVPGDSKIIEVPVLGDWCEFLFGRDDSLTNAPLIERIKRKGKGIYQIFWHPFEFLREGTTELNSMYVDQVERFLAELSGMPGVEFKTIHKAVSLADL